MRRTRRQRALRDHLGLCLDLCHAAVEFEEPSEVCAGARAQPASASTKLQVTAGLRLARSRHDTRALRQPFDDAVYLHQVVERRDGGLTRYVDLPDAPSQRSSDARLSGGEWRVHCHVPMFLDDLGASARRRRAPDALALCREREVSPHLEVETYTWGVLPPALRDAI